MKIKTISQTKNIVTITFKPNLLEKLIGKKEKQEKFREDGHYANFPHLIRYSKQNGEILLPFNKICKAINQWKNSF